MNAKDVMAVRSNLARCAESRAHRMQQWRYEADEIVATYVDCEAGPSTIATLLDSCAVGAEHRDAETQCVHGSLYTRRLSVFMEVCIACSYKADKILSR
jgi:hypothetical protein